MTTREGTLEAIKPGDIVIKVGCEESFRCRVLKVYADGDLAHFEVITKSGKRDRRWSANGGFTGSLRWWKKLEETDAERLAREDAIAAQVELEQERDWERRQERAVTTPSPEGDGFSGHA